MKYTPVIIIGAGRSGTNMLRDIITNIPSFTTWDCDEINPIWRYGNKTHETDELLPKHATSKTKNYIRKRFNQLHKQNNTKFVVEKTCANSLRLAYVYEIFPEAKFIIINRDGRDVVPSAMKRWESSLDIKYTLKKLRYVPYIDLGYYLFKFGTNRLRRIINKKANLSFWGPIYEGLNDDVKNVSLQELCAKQWQKCAEKTLEDRTKIPKQNILDVKYESFVNNPKEELKRILDFFKTDLSDSEIEELTKNVSNKSVGSHLRIFSKKDINKLNTILKQTLNKLNYN